MKEYLKILSMVLVITLAVYPIISSVQAQQIYDPRDKNIPPIPSDLKQFYNNFRQKHTPELVHFLLAGSWNKDTDKVAKDFFSIGNFMVVHDTGKLQTNTSRLAENYLKDNVTNPLKAKKSITLQTGETLKFKKLDRLSTAKLYYYYVRDHIFFPHSSDEGGVTNRIPGFNLLVTTTSERVRFPTETVAAGVGACADQALLLAALLYMDGYEVAIGTAPSIGTKNEDGSITWAGYHVCVYLKDEGWGIGRHELKDDEFGNKMDGKWIILDPINSPRHVQNMRMMGGGKVLEFGDDPAWLNIISFDDPLVGYALIDEKAAKEFSV